jgi:hypothetical protein
MQSSSVEIEGEVRVDGTLVVHDKVSLPPDPVRITVQPRTDRAPAEQFWAGMHAIWADQAARGHVPREKEEIDAEIDAFREEMEEEMEEYERLHLPITPLDSEPE